MEREQINMELVDRLVIETARAERLQATIDAAVAVFKNREYPSARDILPILLGDGSRCYIVKSESGDDGSKI